MATLSCKESLRLFDTSEFPNEKSSLYELESFDDSDLNQVFCEDEIDEKLNDLLNHFYGGGTYFEVDDEMYDDGILYISLDDDSRLEIRDLRDQISADDERATYFLLIDNQYQDRRWIVAEKQGLVYSDVN